VLFLNKINSRFIQACGSIWLGGGGVLMDFFNKQRAKIFVTCPSYCFSYVLIGGLISCRRIS
jgi:hypothetical protein